MVFNTNEPKVYIIIINYNGWADTIECLESILKSKYANYQIIIIDNCSCDNSVQYIKSWAEGSLNLYLTADNALRKLSFPPSRKPIPMVYYETPNYEEHGEFDQELPGGVAYRQSGEANLIIFIKLRNNVGFAGGNNVGIKYALKQNDFEYIWFLNNDTVVSNAALFEMVGAFNTDNAVGMVGSKLLKYYEPQKLQTLCGSYKMSWTKGGSGRYIFADALNSEKFNKIFEIKGYIVGASLMTRKDVILKVGMFDESYFMWSEETDLCMKVLRKGYKLYCCGQSEIWHKEGGSTGMDKVSRFLWKDSKRPTLKRFVISGYLDIRNKLYFVKKHYNIYFFIIYVVFVIVKIFKRIIGIIIFDDKKFLRIKILVNALFDGVFGNMGKPDKYLK